MITLWCGVAKSRGCPRTLPGFGGLRCSEAVTSGNGSAERYAEVGLVALPQHAFHGACTGGHNWHDNSPGAFHFSVVRGDFVRLSECLQYNVVCRTAMWRDPNHWLPLYICVTPLGVID